MISDASHDAAVAFDHSDDWGFLEITCWGTAALEFRSRRLERAIGVIYRPETERLSHYFSAQIADQFDAIIHFKETAAVEPLPHAEEEQTPEVPETYPVGV